jgi:hypothetical protein
MNVLTSSFLATGLVLVGGVFGRWQKSPPDLDQQVLDQLKKAGSNLSKPHDIEFFLYLLTKELANSAAEEIEEEGATVKVERAADDSAWLCFATKRMVPDHAELVRLRKKFNGIASRLKGEYDGWGTEVVK